MTNDEIKLAKAHADAKIAAVHAKYETECLRQSVREFIENTRYHLEICHQAIASCKPHVITDRLNHISYSLDVITKKVG